MKPVDRGDRDPGEGGKYATAGLTFVLTVALVGALGYWVDQKAGTMPWFTLIGSLIGLGLGGFWLFQRVGRRDPKK